MNIYRPLQLPPARPIVWSPDVPYSPPIPETVWRDDEVRRGIEHALGLEAECVRTITKTLREQGLSSLHSVQLQYPYKAPDVERVPCSMSSKELETNRLLQTFAYDAYDALAQHFRYNDWRGWFIAPYFLAGDDRHSVMQLGVFVDETFITEVVE